MGEGKEVPLLVAIALLEVITAVLPPCAEMLGLTLPSEEGPYEENEEDKPSALTEPTQNTIGIGRCTNVIQRIIT